MNVTLTNSGAYEIPVASSQGGGFFGTLDPGANLTVNQAAVTVVVVGEKPDFWDSVTEDLKDLAAAIVRFIRRRQARVASEGEDSEVSALILNNGPNGIRVILGDNTKDHELPTGASIEAKAPGYIELRELGV